MEPLSLVPGAGLQEALQGAAELLGARPWCQDFYLAGTAALSLYVDHREGRGLDLMSGGNRLTSPKRRDILGDVLSADGDARVETARDGFLYLRLGSGVAVKLYYYPYPLVDPEGAFSGLEVASAVDLGLMKLGAIISRGTRRDFVDLFLLCQRLPLEVLLQRSPEKFGHVRDFPLQALKGLADLSLVEGEPMPRLHRPVEWEQVETWLQSEVRRLGREKVGLGEASKPLP